MPSKYSETSSRQQGRLRSVPTNITLAAIASLQCTGLRVVGVSTMVWGVKKDIGSRSSRYGQLWSIDVISRPRAPGNNTDPISRVSIALIEGWEELQVTLEKDFGIRAMLL